jgi:ATP-dependent DNA helicase DinG
VRWLLGPAGPLSLALDGYENREGQLAMAQAVERALDGDRVLLCEAGTGTGKTLAYLVPAILSGRKIVVSTATKALQEQIYTKDLPLIQGQLGLETAAVLVKGLGNYLCLRRFNELRQSPEAAAGGSTLRSLPLVEAWSRETETGDVAELAMLAEGDPIWREIASSSETRIGSSCAYFNDCFVTRMKREMEQARIIVVNHHLFFADLAVKMAASRRGFAGAGALPPYDAVIFDEAHELEDIATDFFGTRISKARVETMLRDADRSFVSSGLADPILGKGEGTVITSLVREASERMFTELSRFGAGAEGRVTLARDIWSGGLRDAYHHFDSMLEALSGYADAHDSAGEAVKLVADRATELRKDAAQIVDPARNQVTWVEVRARGVSTGASPIEVGWLFRQNIFERLGTVVLTSATLTAGRPPDFRFLRSRIGLDSSLSFPVDELSVPSPFDFAERALLYTPMDLPEVSDATFVASASARVAELITLTGGGAFVLCTSVRGMQAIARALRTQIPMRLMVQGEAPKGTLLSRFRADRNAVLVATMSFWEGVDVPGDALRLVILEKLPFAVPTDPVVAARSHAIEEAGGNAFASYSVPQAAITLKQGFGRLLRTRSDRGIVAILDRRVRTRGYGKVLLSSLPPARCTDCMQEVQAFWARTAAAPARCSG